jgi:hypothetical protein
MLLSEANEQAAKYPPCDHAGEPEVRQVFFSRSHSPRQVVRRLCRAVEPNVRRKVADCEGCQVRTEEGVEKE